MLSQDENKLDNIKTHRISTNQERSTKLRSLGSGLAAMSMYRGRSVWKLNEASECVTAWSQKPKSVRESLVNVASCWPVIS